METKQVATIIVSIMLLLNFISLSYADSISTSDDNIITTTTTTSNSPGILEKALNYLKNLFTISGVKPTYQQGEKVNIVSTFTIDNCAETSVNIYLDETLIDTIQLGKVYQQTKTATHTIDTSKLSIGTHTIKDEWKCADLALIKSSFGEPNPSTKTFQITTKSQTPCEEDWQCTDWRQCTNGVQFRTCTEVNNCGTVFDRPLHSQECTGGCTLKTQRKCVGEAAYWFDSCGNQGDLIQDCSKLYVSTKCENGECVSPGGEVCGDKIINFGEECDDGNTANGDGCSSTCKIENPPTSEKGDIRINQDKKVDINTQIAYFDDPATFKIPLKNYGDKEETINLEAGFYSPGYAKDTAELFSAVPLFSVVPTPNCNPYEDFVSTKQVTLAPGEEETVELQVVPYKAFTTYSKGTHKLSSEPLVYFYGIYQECLGGYINEAGTTGKGIMFDYGEYPKSDCSFRILGVGGVKVMCGEEKIGTCSGSTLTIDKKIGDHPVAACNIPLTIDVVNGTVNDTELGKDSTFRDIKKYPLTKEEISESTTADLVAAACLSSKECLEYEDEDGEKVESSCVKLSKLKEDDVLTQSQEDDFFSQGSTLIKGGAVGSGAALALCAVSSAVTGGLAYVACAAGGALLGIAGISALQDIDSGAESLISDILTRDDELTKAIKEGDSNTVGICTVDNKFNYCQFTEWAAFIDLTGDECNDGLIILITGLFLIIILLNAGKRK